MTSKLFKKFIRKSILKKQSPPSGPPRPGLVWKPTTHRWIRPTDAKTSEGKDEMKEAIKEHLEANPKHSSAAEIVSTLNINMPGKPGSAEFNEASGDLEGIIEEVSGDLEDSGGPSMDMDEIAFNEMQPNYLGDQGFDGPEKFNNAEEYAGYLSDNIMQEASNILSDEADEGKGYFEETMGFKPTKKNMSDFNDAVIRQAKTTASMQENTDLFGTKSS